MGVSAEASFQAVRENVFAMLFFDFVMLVSEPGGEAPLPADPVSGSHKSAARI